MSRNSSDPSTGWCPPFWLALLVASSVAFSLGFACATPFAAFAAIAACTLPRRDAVSLAVGVWLANQAVGFALLGYPWSVNCVAWGVVLGLSAVLSTLAACSAVGRLGMVHAIARTAAALAAAFVAYEASLIAASLLLGGIENFSPAIQARIFAVNAAALVGLIALHRAGIAVGIASASRSPRHLPSPVA